MNKQFQYGTYLYDYVLKFESRKTLSLTVTPEIQLIVKAPRNTEQARIELFLRKKWVWLEKQVRFFKKFKKRIYRREYVSGEHLFYLGRQYQLIVQRGEEDGILPQRGKLILTTKSGVRDSRANKRILTKWLRERAASIFADRLVVVLKAFPYKIEPAITVKNMEKRWGSFTGQKRIILNSKLIHASKDCIDYVITHELCHFKYKKHNNAFYRLLGGKCPNWEKVKEKLETRYL